MSSGNVVNISIALYRNHFHSYLLLAAQSMLWYLLPIYGWAKATQLQALIARQAYSELIEQPETLSALRQQLRGYTWDFWALHVLVWLAGTTINFGLSAVGASIILPMTIVIAAVPNNFTLFLLVQALQVVLTLVTWGVILWFYSRFIVAELSLAVEPRAHSWSALVRSWRLTPKWNFRIQLAIGSMFLVTVPLFTVAFFVPLLISLITAASLPNEFADSSTTVGLFFLLFFGVFLLLLLVIVVLGIPLWQALKAALYFDLLNRREGRNLQLRTLPQDLPVPAPSEQLINPDAV
ncbi:hypothetical protein HC928_03100 [bacterium]|nr:hypothetical protein [bacterium]